jgi:hypothetical protein
MGAKINYEVNVMCGLILIFYTHNKALAVERKKPRPLKSSVELNRFAEKSYLTLEDISDYYLSTVPFFYNL